MFNDLGWGYLLARTECHCAVGSRLSTRISTPGTSWPPRFSKGWDAILAVRGADLDDHAACMTGSATFWPSLSPV